MPSRSSPSRHTSAIGAAAARIVSYECMPAGAAPSSANTTSRISGASRRDRLDHRFEGAVDDQDRRAGILQRVDDLGHAPAYVARVQHAAAPGHAQLGIRDSGPSSSRASRPDRRVPCPASAVRRPGGRPDPRVRRSCAAARRNTPPCGPAAAAARGAGPGVRYMIVSSYVRCVVHRIGERIVCLHSPSRHGASHRSHGQRPHCLVPSPLGEG